MKAIDLLRKMKETRESIGEHTGNAAFDPVIEELLTDTIAMFRELRKHPATTITCVCGKEHPVWLDEEIITEEQLKEFEK